jgi:uncharacterized protein YegP (UPF0339 family)
VPICSGVWQFEVFKDEDHGWRWRLVQRNTLIVAESSERFARRSDAKRAAETVRREIGAASVALV